MNFTKSLRTPFLQNTSGRLLLQLLVFKGTFLFDGNEFFPLLSEDTYNHHLFSQKSSVVDVRLVSEYASDYETMHCRGICIETATGGVL